MTVGMEKALEGRAAGLYAPGYYSEFRCIGGKCRHSCCIDWEICIDEVTYEKYLQLEQIRKTISESEDGPCFALRRDGRCPHLNDAGLCRIILDHGEDYLSEICRNHPRFFNRINAERAEAGLGIVCEEACRLILENESPFSLARIDDIDGDEPIERELDALPIRDHIISIIETEAAFEEKLAALRSEFDIPERHTLDEWLERLLALEILDPAWEADLRSMRGVSPSREGTDEYGKYYSRLLTYFVYRHISVSDSEDELRARLAFCILSVEVIARLFEAGSSQALEALIDWSRRYSAEIEYSQDNTDELIFAFFA